MTDFEAIVNNIYNNNAHFPDKDYGDLIINEKGEIDDNTMAITNDFWVVKYLGPQMLQRIIKKDISYTKLYLNELSGDVDNLTDEITSIRDKLDDLEKILFKDIDPEDTFVIVTANTTTTVTMNKKITKAVTYYLNKDEFWLRAKGYGFLFESVFLNLFDKQYLPLLIKAIYTDEEYDWYRIGLVKGLNLNISCTALTLLLDKYFSRTEAISLPQDFLPDDTELSLQDTVRNNVSNYLVIEYLYFFNINQYVSTNDDKLTPQDVQNLTSLLVNCWDGRWSTININDNNEKGEFKLTYYNGETYESMTLDEISAKKWGTRDNFTLLITLSSILNYVNIFTGLSDPVKNQITSMLGKNRNLFSKIAHNKSRF